MNKIVAFILGLLLLAVPAYAEDDMPTLEITGVVVFTKPPRVDENGEVPRRYRNSVIVDDKIVFAGDTFVVVNGKLKYRIDPEKAQVGDDLIKLTKVGRDPDGVGYALFEYQGFTIKRRLKSRTAKAKSVKPEAPAESDDWDGWNDQWDDR